MMTVGIPKQVGIWARITAAFYYYFGKTGIVPNEIWLGFRELDEFSEYVRMLAGIRPHYGWRWTFDETHVRHRQDWAYGMRVCRADVPQELVARFNPDEDKLDHDEKHQA